METVAPPPAGRGVWRVEGWCFQQRGGGPLTGLRFRWSGGRVSARRGRARLHLTRLYPGVVEAAFAGFALDVTLPPGRHAGVLECRTHDGRWVELAALRLGHRGSKGLLRAVARLAHRRGTEPGGEASLRYADWVRLHDTLTAAGRTRAAAHGASLRRRPLLSILLPASAPRAPLLRRAIGSVLRQLYAEWELCLVAGPANDRAVARVVRDAASADIRVRAVFRSGDDGAAGACTEALELARGEFVAILGPEDEIPPHALLVVADAVAHRPGVDLLYSDEDRIDARGRRSSPLFKPDWDPDLALSQDIFSRLGVWRAALVRAAGGFRPGFDVDRDWDLVLRCAERSTPDRIVHLPHILYHRRLTPEIAPGGQGRKGEAAPTGSRAVAEHLERVGVRGARVESAPIRGPRVVWPLPDPAPAVAIIIPTRDRADLLTACLDSLEQATDYPGCAIVVVDNGSADPDARKLLAAVESTGRAVVLRHPGPFNYSALNNHAVRGTQTDVVVLLNDDVRAVDPGWLREMVSLAVRPGVGAVGARLLYPTGALQHAGLFLGYEGVAGHLFRGLTDAPPHVAGWAHRTRQVSAVTAACLAIDRRRYLEVGGFDETAFPVAYNDVDLCLKLRRAGYRNLYAPAACLIHLEQASRRPLDVRPAEKVRRKAEMIAFHERWHSWLDSDPAYNPNLTLNGEDAALAFPPRHLSPWEPRGPAA